MAWSTLNGEPLISARVTIPYYGLWSADVAIAVDASLPTENTLVLGDLSLVGYTRRASEFAGQVLVRLGGGAGGWRKAVASRMYSQPGGVQLRTVLGDVAREVGETVSIAEAKSIGSAYVREAAPASRILRQLAPVDASGLATWWVDPAGVTHVGPRDTSAITSRFDVLHYDGGRGRVEVATETLADWTPGRTIAAPTLPSTLVIGSVTHTADNAGKSRVEALVAADQTAAARLRGPMQSLEREDEPRRTFGGVYEYAVQSGGHLLPLDPSIGLPNVTAPVLTVSGALAAPLEGSTALVLFANEDPTNPRLLPGSATSVVYDLGTGTAEHMATVEAVFNILQALATVVVGPWTNATVTAGLKLTAAAAATQTLDPVTLAAILAALAAKTGDAGGTEPSVGCPNLKGG